MTPAAGSSGLFVFTLKIGEAVLGDGIPAFEWQSVRALSDLRLITDQRVDPDLHSPTRILDLLTSDEWLDVDDEHNLYGLTLVQWGEAMDAYVHRCYLWRDAAIFLFREHNRTNGPDFRYLWDEAVIARVDAAELAAIAAATEAAFHALDAPRR